MKRRYKIALVCMLSIGCCIGLETCTFFRYYYTSFAYAYLSPDSLFIKTADTNSLNVGFTIKKCITREDDAITFNEISTKHNDLAYNYKYKAVSPP